MTDPNSPDEPEGGLSFGPSPEDDADTGGGLDLSGLSLGPDPDADTATDSEPDTEPEPDTGSAADLPEPEETGAGAAEPAEPATPRAAGPQLFDFRRPNKFSREHVRAMSLIHETFARQVGTVLSATLRSVSHVTVASVEQHSYDDYISTSPNPSLLTIVSLEPLSGAGILQMPLPLAMSILDRLLGGNGSGPYPSRPLTEVEEGLITEVLNRCLAELAAAFESLVALEPKIIELESNPQFAQVAAPSDMVVVVTFDTSVGGQQGDMSLCIPFVTLEPRLESMTGRSLTGERRFGDLAGAAAVMEQNMRDVPVDVSVRFDPVTLTSREVVSLQVGDVLPLRHPSDRPLAVLAGGVPLLPAVAGRKRNRLACRIVDSDLEGAS